MKIHEVVATRVGVYRFYVLGDDQDTVANDANVLASESPDEYFDWSGDYQVTEVSVVSPGCDIWSGGAEGNFIDIVDVPELVNR